MYSLLTYAVNDRCSNSKLIKNEEGFVQGVFYLIENIKFCIQEAS